MVATTPTEYVATAIYSLMCGSCRACTWTTCGQKSTNACSASGPLGIQFERAILFNGVPAFFAQENSELLKTAEALTGHAGTSVAFGTEAPFLQQLGMDTIIMGPGSIDQAHQPDEYLSLDLLEPTVGLLQKLILKYCAAG